MYKTLNDKEWKRMTEEFDKVKYQCSNCGHKVVITNKHNKKLCNWCKHYVFKSKQDEFMYRLNEKRNEVK